MTNSLQSDKYNGDEECDGDRVKYVGSIMEMVTYSTQHITI